jgi:hypothetical protein
MSESPLPMNEEAERATLGCIFLNHEVLDQVVDWLKPEMFWREENSLIYRAILTCRHQGLDPNDLTVYEQLRRQGQWEAVGGLGYINSLSDYAPASSWIEHYARIVIDAWRRRRLINIGGQIAAMGYQETSDLDLLLAKCRDLLEGNDAPVSTRYRPFSSDELDAEQLPPLRWIVPGILPEGLTLLVGKPKMRKSWMALALALAVASGGRALGSIPVEQGDVLYMALEDGKRRLQSRQRKILSGAGAPKCLHYLTAAPRIDDGCVNLIQTWLKRRPAARLVIIDVLAKVRPRNVARGGSMYDEDYAAIEPLQQLAERNQISILVVHHMNRSGAEDVFDLINGSNGIGGAADGVLALQYERTQTDATLKISGREIEDDSDLAVKWDNTTAQWVLLGKAEEVKISNERQEIIRCLREEKRPMTPREVADVLGKASEHQNIKQLMYRMAKTGDLQWMQGGKYTTPNLTLLPPPGDRVIDGDREAITGFYRNATPETSPVIEGDRNQHSENPDHRRSPITDILFDASELEKGGDRAPITPDHPLAPIPQHLQMTTRMMLLSDHENNIAAARARCAEYGIDYELARRWLLDQGGKA